MPLAVSWLRHQVPLSQFELIMAKVTLRPTTSKKSLTSHTGQVLSRAVTFQFATDPNAGQQDLFAKCAGARRYTINHHLARVKANLEAQPVERESLSDREAEGDLRSPSI